MLSHSLFGITRNRHEYDLAFVGRAGIDRVFGGTDFIVFKKCEDEIVDFSSVVGA